MTLTVADIDRWNAGAVREVFQAANARGQATLEASRQLSTLSVFDTWEGATAEARKHVNAGIRQDLDAHGNEALAVARAADQAADGIEHVQSDLRTLRSDAGELHMAIDATTNRVVPGANCLPTEALIAEMQLQPRLDAILAEANAVDQELAAAINMADGDVAIPPDAGPPVGPQGLTPTQRESDANQERVREERAKLQAHINDLKQAITRAGGDQNRLQDLNSQLDAAQNRMGEYDAIDDALTTRAGDLPDPTRHPDRPESEGPAAVAVGNPDTATDISVTVPGIGSTTKDSLPSMVAEARNLQNTAAEKSFGGWGVRVRWLPSRGWATTRRRICSTRPARAISGAPSTTTGRRPERRRWLRIFNSCIPITPMRISACSGTATVRSRPRWPCSSSMLRACIRSTTRCSTARRVWSSMTPVSSGWPMDTRLS